MAGRPQNLKWGVEKRLEFIEFRLFWEGGINRSEIMEQFGISVPQASKDLSQYQELARGNIEYNKSEKRYFVTKRFRPRLFNPNADQYLFQLRSLSEGLISSNDVWSSNRPEFDVLAMPHRRIDPMNLKAIMEAIRKGASIEIEYQSMSRKEPGLRWITPHAFAFDGMRWHVRAFCHNRNQFRDFLLPRVFSTGELAEQGERPQEDYVWNEYASIALMPHPKLSEAQSRAVEIDFEMENGQLKTKLRLGLLYYFLRRLGLDFEEQEKNPHEQHVVMANPEEVKQWLDRAQYKTPR